MKDSDDAAEGQGVGRIVAVIDAAGQGKQTNRQSQRVVDVYWDSIGYIHTRIHSVVDLTNYFGETDLQKCGYFVDVDGEKGEVEAGMAVLGPLQG